VYLLRGVYLLLPYDPFLIKGAIAVVFAIFYLSVILYLYFWGKSGKRARAIWFSVVIVCFGYLIYDLEIVVEQFHLVEYSILTGLYYVPLKKIIRDKMVFCVLFLSIVLIGMVDEGIQFYLPARVGELWDITINGMSAILTIILLDKVFFPGVLNSQVSSRNVRIASGLSIFSLLIFGIFFVTVTDWGFRHTDPEIGVFYSHFTLKNLMEKDKWESQKYSMAIKALFPEKAQKYLQNQLNRDKFQMEILAHLFRREHYEQKGDYWVAFKENLILSNYFNESIVQSGYGWSSEKLSQIRQKMQSPLNKNYESPVSKGELVVTFGPAIFWSFLFLMISGFIWIRSEEGQKQLLKTGFIKT
jgi:hypothetical protein